MLPYSGPPIADDGDRTSGEDVEDPVVTGPNCPAVLPYEFRILPLPSHTYVSLRRELRAHMCADYAVSLGTWGAKVDRTFEHQLPLSEDERSLTAAAALHRT